MFGERLFPIGTLYDPFIARGLDALNYACYQDARFLLVATPSGITLGPRRRRPPVDQPAADRARPARPAPLRARLRRRARGDDGGSVPADRRSRRRIDLSPPLDPLDRARSSATATAGRPARLTGGYWLREPGPDAEAAIVAMGAVMPEALAAWDELARRHPRPRPAQHHLARPPPPRLDARRRPRAGRASASQAMSKPCCRASRPAPASSPSPMPRPPRCPGSAACSASASRRSGSTASARPATSPTSTPPTASTAPRSPRRLPRLLHFGSNPLFTAGTWRHALRTSCAPRIASASRSTRSRRASREAPLDPPRPPPSAALIPTDDELGRCRDSICPADARCDGRRRRQACMRHRRSSRSTSSASCSAISPR